MSGFRHSILKTVGNPDLVYQAIRGGLAGSTVLDAKAPMVMDRNFKPGFRISRHSKIWPMRWIPHTAWAPNCR